jgi:hypothetical protein
LGKLVASSHTEAIGKVALLEQRFEESERQTAEMLQNQNTTSNQILASLSKMMENHKQSFDSMISSFDGKFQEMHTSNTAHFSTMNRFVTYTDDRFNHMQSDTASQITELTQTLSHAQMHTDQYNLLQSNIEKMDIVKPRSCQTTSKDTQDDIDCHQLPTNKTSKPIYRGSEHEVHASSANGE